MRVIAGSARGRKLQSVKGQKTRPTQDRVKESLFAILADAILIGDFLDLFAGSGSIGIEALSRGAAKAVFVERNKRAASTLRNNLTNTGFMEQSEIYLLDTTRALRRLAGERRRFGCIFLDPPYNEGLIMETLAGIDPVLLSHETVVIAEHHRKEDIPETVGALVNVRQKVYGDTVLTFLKQSV
ncbi:MAG: 16S rRNA (guanine(966)-N(2))-methyltransferase RsmD [Firmicutes bacterium]|nr:16S rRNA (guanine(966)-N(2))-methyltransferase RsmD [Bacillota bacterium]